MRTKLTAVACALSLLLCAAAAGARGRRAGFLSHVKDRAAAASAAEMLDALGGRERWAALRSLYIRATHTEKGVPKAYRSEIWRDLDAVRMRIVQQNEDFHTVVVVSGGRGWVTRRGGETRELTPEQLGGLLHSDAHVIYKTLRKIALGAPSLDLKIDERKRLAVYEGGKLLAALELDERRRPSRYYVPRADGKGESLTIYTAWGESGGYVHPAVSEPQTPDTPVYRAEEWRPSRRPAEVEFAPAGANAAK